MKEKPVPRLNRIKKSESLPGFPRSYELGSFKRIRVIIHTDDDDEINEYSEDMADIQTVEQAIDFLIKRRNDSDSYFWADIVAYSDDGSEVRFYIGSTEDDDYNYFQAWIDPEIIADRVSEQIKALAKHTDIQKQAMALILGLSTESLERFLHLYKSKKHKIEK